MQTLIVYRDWQSTYSMLTTLKTVDGKVKAIFSSSLRQPKYNTKTIVINCNTFALNWDNVETHQMKRKRIDTQKKLNKQI